MAFNGTQLRGAENTEHTWALVKKMVKTVPFLVFQPPSRLSHCLCLVCSRCLRACGTASSLCVSATVLPKALAHGRVHVQVGETAKPWTFEFEPAGARKVRRCRRHGRRRCLSRFHGSTGEGAPSAPCAPLPFFAERVRC